jgi:uncharacterized protein YjiS (DUF1127 family)
MNNIIAAPMRIVGRWTEVLRQRHNMNASIKELHKLKDHELKDIGISRCDIERVARGIIDFHRKVRDSSPREEVQNIIPSAADNTK